MWMSIAERQAETIAREKRVRSRPWLLNWEVYPLLLIAGFLRFYHVDTSMFEGDQVLMWRMAYDAVHHGLLPVTASTASLGFANAPGSIYFLMIPAALTSNPIAGVMLTNLFATVAVIITYIFTTRYYGRIAGTFASLFYATATAPLLYARFLWQPNLMSPFVILFMFALFRGVVERRKGWLFPALLLLGILYQSHGMTLILLVPLFLAITFAPETIRWRDIIYSIIGLTVVFFPFILWHIETHFSDLHIILAQTKQKAVADDSIYQLYRFMLSPYDHNHPPTAVGSYVKALIPYISKLYHVVFFLVVCGLILAVGVAIYQWVKKIRVGRKIVLADNRVQGVWGRIMPTPAAGGLLLLCVWQLAPILALIRHSSPIFPHYLLVAMPGPFILAGYLISKLSAWRHVFHWGFRILLLSGLYAMATLVVIAQLAGSIATIRDVDHGNFYDIADGGIYYSDLYSLQRLFHTADRLARQRHLKRIFIGADFSTEPMMYYFGEHMEHQTTVFSLDTCLFLPSQADGPGILIVPPYNPIGTELAAKNGATLLQESPRLSGAPFKIYEIYPSVTQVSSPENTFAQDIQSSAQGSVDQFGDNKTSWLTSKWAVLQNHPSSYNMTYSYHFTVTLNDQTISNRDTTCTFSATHAGDQMLVASNLHVQDIAPTVAVVKVFSYSEAPDTPMLGPFHLETHRHVMSPARKLQTNTMKESIDLPIRRKENPS
jgi:hypothetical protein